MKSFDQLRTYGKAKLLFDLFPDETAKSIDFINETAEAFQTEPLVIDEFQTEEFWQAVANNVLTNIRYTGKRLYRSHSLFADQLFDGILAVFSVHCLKQYAQQPDIQHTKFGRAIELFF